MTDEEMLRLRLEGKSHADIAKLSTEQGHSITRQGVQWRLKAYPVTRIYVAKGAETSQEGKRGGLQSLLDKIVLKVKKHS